MRRVDNDALDDRTAANAFRAGAAQQFRPRPFNCGVLAYVQIRRKFQQFLDRSTVHVAPRWLGFARRQCPMFAHAQPSWVK